MTSPNLKRPMPPDALYDDSITDDDSLDATAGLFAPDPNLTAWIRATFIGGEGHGLGPLTNHEHKHLQQANIECLWTNIEFKKQGRLLLGTAEMPQARKDWGAQRASYQLRQWFGREPLFLLTFYAPACVAMPDASFCALVEHELYHCAQKLDEYGAPAFDQDGMPRYAIRPHDVQEFVGVVARYGMGAVDSSVFAMVEAANAGPEIALASIAGCCGTCLRKVA